MESAFEAVAERLWLELDEAMGPLWETDAERDEIASSYDADSLLDAEPIAAGGMVRLCLDIEADLAAECLSKEIDSPVLAARRFGPDWCRLAIFEAGRTRAWLFWVSETWARGHEDEVEPALASAARANGGWLGDPYPFGDLLSEDYRVSDLRRLLDADLPDAGVFENEFFRMCGAPMVV